VCINLTDKKGLINNQHPGEISPFLAPLQGWTAVSFSI